MRFRVMLILLIAACALPLAAEPPSLVAIRNARIVTVSGPAIEKGTVVLKNGLIADVGASVTIPPGAWVIEGEGLTVLPGLIDALSTWGIPQVTPVPGSAGTPGGVAVRTQAQMAPPGQRIRGPEDRPNTNSWIKAADLVSPSDRRLEAARSAGFTTAVTFPKQGILAGHGAVVNLAGESAGQMVLDPSSGLYTTLSTGAFGTFPGSLMGVIAYIRQVAVDAQYYKSAKDAYAKNPSGISRPGYDRALEGVLEARRLLLPAVSRVQIARMIEFGKELKIPYVLYGGHEAYRSAELLKQSRVPLILNVKWPVKERDADPEAEESTRTLEVRDKAPGSPGVLAAAGVPFAFSSDGLESPKDLLRAVKKSIDAGLKPEQAIRALTLSPAEIYGVAGRLGSIEKGKIANITVVKGDIFQDSGKVQMVFIDGVKYDPAPEAPAGPPGGATRRPTSVAGEVIQ